MHLADAEVLPTGVGRDPIAAITSSKRRRDHIHGDINSLAERRTQW